MTDSKVIKLVETGAPSPVDESVVTLLEGLLEKAKAGGFNGIACITVTADNAGHYSALGTCFEGQGIRQNSHTALGGVEVLKKRMLDMLFEWEV